MSSHLSSHLLLNSRWHSAFTNSMLQKWHFTPSRVSASRGLVASTFVALTRTMWNSRHSFLRMRDHMENSFVTLARSQHLQSDLNVSPPWPPNLAESESEPPANQWNISDSSWNQQRNSHTPHSFLGNHKL